MTAAASGGWRSLAKSAPVPQFTKTGIPTKYWNSQGVQSHHRWLFPCLTVPQAHAAGSTYQGRHESRAGYTWHFVNNCLLHIALNGLQHGTLQGEQNNSWYGKAVRSVKGDAKAWKAEWKLGWDKVGKSKGHRAAPWEKQHLHQWSDRVLSQQGLGNCHPSQSCLWLSWENRKLSIWHSWASSSQVHTEQQAASITAECQAGSFRSQANPSGVGRQEEKISTQVPSPSTSCMGSCSPCKAAAHTYTPEAFVLSTEHSFLPFSQGPGQCETICEGPGVHHIAALKYDERASASALYRPCTVRLLTPQQGISLEWSAIQEWLTEGTLFPGEVVFCAAPGVNPCLPVESLKIYARILQNISRHSDRS